MRGHDARTQAAQRQIAFLVVRILGVGETGLRHRQHLAGPNKPIRVASLGPFWRLAGQTVGSVTSAGSVTEPAEKSASASVSVRQVPETNTSDGRNRALYAIFRLSGTQ